MTDTPTTPLRQRAAGLAASALVLASLLLTPASALAAGGGPGTPPTLVDDVITTSEETPVTGNVLDNDVNSSGVVPVHGHDLHPACGLRRHPRDRQ